MSFEQWLLIALACIGGAVSPGPSLALVIRHASHSAWSGLVCAWAHALGVGFYAVLAATGLAVLLAQHQLLDMLLSLFAIVWLGRIAVLSWSESDGLANGQAAGLSALRDGLSMGLLNPKVALFFLALFTAVLPQQASLWAQAIAVLTAIMVDGVWYSLVTLALQRAWVKPFLQQHATWLGRISAVVLAGFVLLLSMRMVSVLAVS